MAKNEKDLSMANLSTEELLKMVMAMKQENEALKAEQGKKKEEVKLGTNMDMKVKGNILTITVDLSKNFGTSSSGKSQIVATSGGNIDIAGANGIKIGLNIYKPVK